MSEMDPPSDLSDGEKIHEITPVSGLYKNWFLDYASYVILERAIPAIEDGLKPVQRRILHAMKEMDDGRFNKVANIIGSTMQYHPHGDAAIGDAIVNLGQKELLIETQGNWGDVRTGDSAAAPRYIEARLSKFALEVAFNPQTTNWQASYDGRKKEPITLPMKFPLLLAQGVEGIAVGLSTKIMPHNFIELIDASIAHLKNQTFVLYPDFQHGGLLDVANYQEGQKGGKLRLRAKIEEQDKKTLIIREIPFSTTTSSLIDSILKANDAGKIKIKKVIDNTAEHVEIIIQLAAGVSPDITIDALYAFTDCEIAISPNACVIVAQKPLFLSVHEILRICTDQTKALLQRELEIKLAELAEKWHFSSLEKIFIENKIYRDIEECETWPAVIQAIDLGLEPFKPLLKRVITQEDIVKLTEIKIKRISKFDSFKADEYIKGLENELDLTNENLANLTNFTIAYYENLKKKYGKGKERKTEIKTFDTIIANQVAVANEKLYVNRAEGFIGYGIKKDEYIMDCSDIDDIIVFKRDGKFLVTKVSEKAFVGKDILYASVWKKNDERMIYNVLYVDGTTQITYAKRFAVTAITRDKEYDITKGSKHSKILYFTANSNSESEIVSIYLSPLAKARLKVFDFDFADIAIKARSAQGNIASKHGIKRILFKSKGESTLGGLAIWYDDVLGKLNTDKRGSFLGTFKGDNNVLSIYKDGSYELTTFDLINKYDTEQIIAIGKWHKEKVVCAIYFNAASKHYFAKRFLIETTTLNKRFHFLPEEKGTHLIWASLHPSPELALQIKQEKLIETLPISFNDFVEVKGWKALGNKIIADKILEVIDNSTPIDLTAQEPEEIIEEPEPSPEKPGIPIGATIEFEIRKPETGTQGALF